MFPHTVISLMQAFTKSSRKKMATHITKPFIYGVAVDDAHFIGRQEECRKLAAHMRYGTNTILISPRRWGKTSLVKHVAAQVASEQIRIVHLDIFACRSEYDFLNALAAATLRQTSSHLDMLRKEAQDFLGRIVPRISFSPEPLQDYSLSIGITPKTHAPEEVLNLPEQIARRHGWHIIVCIDEFQQVGDFPDSLSVQKRMRTVWQHQQNVSYCLYGSKKHMMSSLFQSQSKPFYKFGTTMQLPPIPVTEWVPYICQQFEGEGKHISEKLAADICQRVDAHSSYVQELALCTLINTRGEQTTSDEVETAFEDLLNQNDSLFTAKTEGLSTYQMNFLRALSDDIHEDFGKAAIRETYNLGSPTNITRLKQSLLEKEIIDMSDRGIILADPVLLHWLRRLWAK